MGTQRFFLRSLVTLLFASVLMVAPCAPRGGSDVERRDRFHEAGFRSAFEVLTRGDCCNLPIRRAHLDLVSRPDQQAPGFAMARLAAVEAASTGPDTNWSDFGCLQSGQRALVGRCGDIACVCTSAWCACPNAAARNVGRHYCAGGCLARQSPRQFAAAADLASSQRTKSAARSPTQPAVQPVECPPRKSKIERRCGGGKQTGLLKCAPSLLTGSAS